ncbi:MAG: DUF192 domain-containing protein [Gemmatimonadota bacterium]|jgi:hypothetical protein
MKHLRIVNRTRDRELGSHVGLADQWWLRARGFMGRPRPEPGQGLLLSPCRAVHMHGMKYPLDVLFLDRQGRVMAAYPDLAPGRRTAWHGDARYALEVPAGTIGETGTCEGDLVAWLLVEEGADGTGDGGPATATVSSGSAAIGDREEQVKS